MVLGVLRRGQKLERVTRLMAKKKDKRGLPAKCETCGETRHEFVALLVSIEPEQHEIKCDDCYVKEATKCQTQ